MGTHKELHAKLYSFASAVNISGKAFKLLFKKRSRGARKAPLQMIAKKIMGRQAIVQALKRFYVREGYASKGNPSIANVLNKEGPRFINGHHSVRRYCKR